MSDGRIYYTETDGNYYLKLTGDVRVTLCTGLSNYINKIFATDSISSVIVDLDDAKAVDSTTLGLLAKVALHVIKTENIKPMLIIRDASMLRLVEGMGFDEIFEVIGDLPDTPSKLKAIPCTKAPDDEARTQVIDAHKTLMSMNKKNMKTFSELVKALEREADEQG